MISVKNSFEIAYNGTENECRFELYADTASDLQGLTHIDGIKIQMGSECTDIATGDKYILNGSGAWILQPKDNAFTNVYTKAEIDNMSNVIYQTMLYYHTAQESSDGSITFYTLGTPVSSLTIYGNGQQTGTPTSDNPVMPEFVGVRTANLLFEKYENRSINGAGAFTIDNAYDLWLGEVNPGEKYSISNMDYVYGFFTAKPLSNTGATYNGSRGYEISGAAVVTVPEGCTWIAVRVLHNADNAMLNSGITALPYEPFGWAEKITCAGQTTPVYLGEVPTVRRIKKLVFDGQENFNELATGLYQITENGYMRSADTLVGMCSHFGGGYTVAAAPSAKQDTISFLVSASGNNYVYFSPSQYLTIADFKSYLAQQYAAGTPVTVWYVLAEPQTGIVNEPLAKIGDYADELHSEDAGVTIPTTRGQNTLTVGTDLIPCKIVISGGE